MKNIKKLLTTVCAGVLTLTAFSACGAKTLPEGFTFEKYSFNNETTETAQWRTPAPANSNVTFDGVVNASEYLGNCISFSDANGVNLNLYSRMADNGVYFGFKSNDKNVYCNPTAAIYNNTSVEIQLAAGGTEALNANVLQLRYSPDGKIEEWVGIPSSTSYEFTRKFVDTVSKTKVYGELNSSSCSGYEIEAYVPYSSLNLTTKPQSLICAPSFNTRRAYEATGRTTWTIMVGSNFTDPTGWYKIDATEGQMVMTEGFAESNGKILQTGGSNQFYYLDDELSRNYYLKAKVKTGDILNNDGFPKFGVVNKSGNRLLGYYFDIADQKVGSLGKIEAETTEFTGTEWLWDSYSSHTFGDSWALGYNGYDDLADLITYGEETTLELVRYGEVFALKVNGKTVLSDSNVKGMENGSVAGLFFFNTAAEITVEAFTTTETEVASHIAMPDKNIDGDLSDWDLTATQLASETASENNGNQMTVYAYAGTNGLHIAYDVTHCVNTKIYSWNNWWFNVNAEFWIGHEHFAVTQTGSSGLMNAVLKTTEKADGKFQTIAEIFVPYDVLDNFDNVYDLGIAFKACGESTGDAVNFNGSSWWYFTNHFPTNMNVRYTLVKN